MPDPEGFYPFSSQDKQAIPFDIGKPLGLLIQSITDTESGDLDLTTDDCVVVFFSSVRAIVSFGDLSPARTEGSLLADTLFLPANTEVSIKAPANTFKVMAAEVAGEGILYAQVFVRWKALSPDALRSSY